METKQQIIDKLKELGITSDNCYPKTVFRNAGTLVVGLYKGELDSDFYFFNKLTKELLKLPKGQDTEEFTEDLFQGKIKYLVPLDRFSFVWKDEPLEELPDEPYTFMTIRKYACIHRGVPESGVPWLDEIIKKSRI